MSAPLVSTIIPCYNAERWVAATLESALAQTWPNREIILVNDGSRDGSLAVARQFEPRGVRIIDQPNAGASAARNAGLRAARGHYLQFLDADDLLAPDKIKRQLAALVNAPDQVASCAWGIFREQPAEAVFQPEPVWNDFPPVDWLVCSWNGGGMMHPAAWLVPRGVAESAGPWDESLSLDDDGEYFCRILLASRGIKFVAAARTFYRSHDGPRLSASRGQKAALSSFTATALKEQHLLALEDSPRTRRAMASRYSHFAWEHLSVAPDLVARAVARWRALAPDLPPPVGSRLTNLAVRLLGWRAARRLQLKFRDLRPA
jgi:glycosyltransferase involved in cell wall biosynthesis